MMALWVNQRVWYIIRQLFPEQITLTDLYHIGHLRSLMCQQGCVFATAKSIFARTMEKPGNNRKKRLENMCSADVELTADNKRTAKCENSSLISALVSYDSFPPKYWTNSTQSSKILL